MSEQKTIFLRVNEVRFDKISNLSLKSNCFVTKLG